MKKIAAYFIQGLLVFVPITLTIYIIFITVDTIDATAITYLEELFGIRIFRGLGLLVALLFILLVGVLSTTLVFRPLFFLTEQAATRTPLVKIIYTSIKDLFSAFLSDKKKFNQPVMVRISSEGHMHKLGFITQNDLSSLGLEGKVGVYLPHSYNFSGNFFIVNSGDVIPLDASPTEVMKLIVSGGVTNLGEQPADNGNGLSLK